MIREVILVPARNDPGQLLATGPCGFRPPIVWRYEKRHKGFDYRGPPRLCAWTPEGPPPVGHALMFNETPAWDTGQGLLYTHLERALPLVHEGEIVYVAYALLARALTKVVVQGRPNAEDALWLARFGANHGFGTVVALDANGIAIQELIP